MKRPSSLLLSVVVLLLGSALRAADLAKPAGPLGVELPAGAAPLSIPGLPPLSAPPALPGLPASAAVAEISANGGNLDAKRASAPAAPALPAAAAALPASSDGPAPSAAAAAPSAARPAALEQVRAIHERLEAQLKSMEAVLGRPDPVLEHVRAQARASLTKIEAHVEAGRIDPTLEIRTHGEHPEVAPARAPRVGVYPVAADPFQWAHLLIGLRAMAEFQLDKIVYVLAGDDPRKPHMTPAADRHPMGQAVLAAFSPLFAYSPIAVGTDYDGETNIFRMLALNAAHPVHAFYLVGGDHYKLKDKNGNDDTIPKIEKKSADSTLGHDPAKHQVSVAFIARGDESERIPTSLQVHFLPPVPFEASSTQIRRDGQYALMPHAAYQWVLDNLPGHYGIEKPK